MMCVAQRMLQARQRVIGLEMIMYRDAAGKIGRHRAALFRDPVMGEAGGRNTVQPAGFAADAKAGFIEMAHRARRQSGRDAGFNRLQFERFAGTPGHDAGRA
jgi:hypothetical protein